MEAISDVYERVILAYMMANPRANLNLKETDFFFEENKTLYKLLKKGVASPIMIREQLKDPKYEKTLAVLTDIEDCPPVDDIGSFVKEITAMAGYREFTQIAHEIENGTSFDIAGARKAILGIRAYSKAKSMKELFTPESIDNLAKKKVLRTGFPKLDDVYRFEEGQLMIVAGETSKGKTQFAMNVSKAVAEEGGKVLFITLEMNPDQVLGRFVAMTLDYPIYQAFGSNEEYRQFAKRFMLTSNWTNNIYIDHECSDLGAILGDINEIRPDLTVIDYAQLVKVDGKGGEEKVIADIAQTLRTVCHDHRIILVSQFSRQTEAGSKNPLDRLKGSGALAYSASAVVYIERRADSLNYYTLLKNTTGMGHGVGVEIPMANINGRFQEVA
jgi:replicative DNA helicase